MTALLEWDEAAAATALLDEAAPPLQQRQPVVPPAKAERPRSARYQSLDIWRGLACLMLVMYHATFYAEHSWRSGDPGSWTIGGLAVNLFGRLWIGVPIFFVVSGYCIAASCDASRDRTRSLRTYFARRFRRIYPPLWIACGLCVTVALVASQSESIVRGCHQLPHLAEFTRGNWLGNFTATEAWRPQVSGGETTYLMKNTWTLCYEEQFYFVVGMILLVAATRFYSAAIVVTLATLAARHLSRAADSSLEGFFCDGHWLLFATGILVHHRLHHARKRRWAIFAVLAGVAAYAVADYRMADSHFDKHLDEYLVVSSLFGMLLTGLYRIDARLTASRWLQPLAWYGKMSYSVYLTHFPVVVVLAYVLSRVGSTADWFVAAVTVPLSVAISVPLGYAFHLAVERHFMNAPLAAKRAAAGAAS